MTWAYDIITRIEAPPLGMLGAAGLDARFVALMTALYALAAIGIAWMYLIALGSARRPPDPPGFEGEWPMLTVVVACYDEELVLERNVKAVTGLDYPADRIQFVYVFDRGRDRTPEVLAELAREHPIEVVENGSDDRSKAGAINYVVDHHARGDIIAVYDADTCPHPGNARRAVAWLASEPDLGLVNGRRRILNSRENPLTRLVAVEYHALYRVEHYGRAAIGGVSLFYGSNGFFRKSALQSVGGFDSGMLVEDVDAGFRLLEAGYRTRYDPVLEEFDEAPPTLAAWWRQRLRWGRGWIQVTGRHIRLLKRLKGFQRASAAFVLATVPAPLFVLPAWLMLVPYLFDSGYRAAFWNPTFWLVAWTAPLVYFLMGWMHDAVRGERRWHDLPLVIAVLPMVAYYTLRSMVMWNAFFLHFARRKARWVKTERSRRAARVVPTLPVLAAVHGGARRRDHDPDDAPTPRSGGLPRARAAVHSADRLPPF